MLAQAESHQNLSLPDNLSDVKDFEFSILQLRKKKRLLEKEMASKNEKWGQKQKLVGFCGQFQSDFNEKDLTSAFKRIDALDYNAKLYLQDPTKKSQ